MKAIIKFILSFFVTGIILAGVMAVLVSKGSPVAFVIFITILITSVIGFFASLVLSRPIRRLSQGMDIICSGNLEYRVGTNTEDEIGQISRAIDEITDDLSKVSVSVDDLNLENTHIKETEKELQTREGHFRKLFEHANDAVFIYDFDGNILDVNNKACKMLGYSKEDLLKISFLDLHTEEELTRSKEAFKDGTETCSIRFDSKFRRSDGSVFDVEISSSVVDLTRGLMQAVVCDITERKDLEEALRISEEKFRTFMETATDLMFITNKDGDLTYVNQSMVSLLGYSREELIGMAFSEILDQESVEVSKKRREILLADGEDIHDLVLEAKNRRKIFGEMRATGIFDNNGHFHGIRSIFRDMTERKRIEESQRLSQLGRLAADVAHEVKNQLTVISGMAELSLMDPPADSELVGNLQTIYEQSFHVNDVVKRLLMFSKPSTGDFKEVNINDSIGIVVEMIKKQFTRDSVEIVTEFSSSLPPIKADSKQMLEVFMNLLQNSSQAMRGGGPIKIKTSKIEYNVRIEVQDTGKGISEEDLNKIFDPFFTTKVNGTGLGLSACYGIIKAHNGEIVYTSQLGEGTTATIYLPVAAEVKFVEKGEE